MLVGADRVEQVRHEQPIDDEAGPVRRGDRLLAERLREREHRRRYVSSLVVSARIDLDELHQRHRIEEVQAAEPVGPLRRRRQLGDAERRGVGDEDRVRADDRLRAPRRSSRFSSRFSTIASMTRSQSFRSSNVVVPDRLPSVASRASAVTLPLATPSSRNFSMRPRPFCRNVVVHFAHDRLVTRRRAHLRDARAHQSAAQHADRLDRHVCPI